MYPTITVARQGRTTLYLTIVDPIDVGRECDGLILADEKVSRRHLRLSAGQHGLVVTDLGSTNGSFIDGVRVQGQTTLQPGSTLVLGDTAIRVQQPPRPPAQSATTVRDVGGTIVATVRPADLPAQAAGPGAAPASAAPPRGPAPSRQANQSLVETRRTSIDELEASFRGQPVSLPTGTADDTVTIMFSDIESSTELALGMGDEQWYRILTWHNQLVSQRVQAHGGFIVKNQGDGFMVTFNSARRAIICASEIQQALHRQSSRSDAVRVRIGMHTGEAIRQDSGDLFGRHVIIAARIGSIAAGGEIMVSSIVREIAAARGDLHFGEPREVTLKGIGPQTLYSVLWGADLPSS